MVSLSAKDFSLFTKLAKAVTCSRSCWDDFWSEFIDCSERTCDKCQTKWRYFERILYYAKPLNPATYNNNTNGQFLILTSLPLPYFKMIIKDSLIFIWGHLTNESDLWSNSLPTSRNEGEEDLLQFLFLSWSNIHNTKSI